MHTHQGIKSFKTFYTA